MIDANPSITRASSIWRDQWFYRGIILIPILAALGFLLMLVIEPSSQISFIVQTVFAALLLLASFVLQRRNRRLGLGMIAGWALFVLFPVVWVLLPGFTGNLMS